MTEIETQENFVILIQCDEKEIALLEFADFSEACNVYYKYRELMQELSSQPYCYDYKFEIWLLKNGRYSRLGYDEDTYVVDIVYTYRNGLEIMDRRGWSRMVFDAVPVKNSPSDPNLLDI